MTEPGAFEFVVADRGIGVRRRRAAYAALTDEGKALEAALTDGLSRHGPVSNRGLGFASTAALAILAVKESGNAVALAALLKACI